jgi:hypothetical protein
LLQEAFRHKKNHRIRLSAGVHDAVDNFRWLHQDLVARPTRLYEIVPTKSTILGSHGASGYGAGGVWLPTATATPRQATYWASSRLPDDPEVTASPAVAAPVVWRTAFPPDIVADLVTFENPKGTITNSDLERAGSILHHEAGVHCFDVRKRTLKSSTDNTPTLYWQQKGSATTTSAPAYLLRVQAIHRRYHRSIRLHDFLAGTENTMADDASRLHHLTHPQFLTHFNSLYPQPQPWRLWIPTPSMTYALTLALRRKRSKPELFLSVPQPRIPTGASGQNSASASPSLLSSIEDPVALLQVYGQRYRTGKIAPNKRAVQSRTVEDALRSVGQTFAGMGAADPRLTSQGKIDF